MTTETTTTNTTTKPIFTSYFVYGCGMDDHELWGIYDTEEDMRRDCASSIALDYEGTEIEKREWCIRVMHNYYEII